MKKLIATDFDGTFIRNGVIDPGYHTAIRDFREAGGLFGFVTGRGTDFFRTAEEYGVPADFFCLYNGSLLALPDGTPVKEYRIPRADFAALEAFFAASPEVCSFDRAAGAPANLQQGIRALRHFIPQRFRQRPGNPFHCFQGVAPVSA